MPGDNVEMVCELVHDVAAEAGSRFTLREGGKTSKFCFHMLHQVPAEQPRYSRHWYRHEDPGVCMNDTRLLYTILS